MEKSNTHSAFHGHFIAWFIALCAFAFFEWRHVGFVSYIFPFPLLVIMPGLMLIAERAYAFYREK